MKLNQLPKTSPSRGVLRAAALPVTVLATGMAIATATAAPSGSRTRLEACPPRPAAIHRSFMIELAGCKTGRVLLHTFCLVRNPERARWHWQGIVREFAG